VALRIAGALLALLVLVVVGASLVVSRMAAGDDVRSRIVEAVRESTGRDFSYGELHAGLLPPRLELLDARMAGPTPDAPPFLEARRVSVRLALLPLLVRVVAADPLVVEGATLRVERTADGRFSWPRRVREPRAADAEKRERDETRPEEPSRKAPSAEYAVRTLELRDVRLVMEDGRETWKVAAAESRGRAVPCGPERFAVDVQVTGADVELADARAQGDLVLQADLHSRKGEGEYRLDATHADVLFRGYPKPGETPAVFTLDLRRERGRYTWGAPALELFGEPLVGLRESPCDEVPAP
jgi:uncharacterized protein involved in outer membrane biogenesis